MVSMSHFGIDNLHHTPEPKHYLPSLAAPKVEMVSFFQLYYSFRESHTKNLIFGCLHTCKAQSSHSNTQGHYK